MPEVRRSMKEWEEQRKVYNPQDASNDKKSKNHYFLASTDYLNFSKDGLGEVRICNPSVSKKDMILDKLSYINYSNAIIGVDAYIFAKLEGELLTHEIQIESPLSFEKQISLCEITFGRNLTLLDGLLLYQYIIPKHQTVYEELGKPLVLTPGTEWVYQFRILNQVTDACIRMGVRWWER